MAGMQDERYRWYLYDLGFLVKEYARKAKAERDQHRGGSEEGYWIGHVIAYSQVISLMQQQAEGFDIPLRDLRLEDIEPDRDLI
jgi:hypothetical protein